MSNPQPPPRKIIAVFAAVLILLVLLLWQQHAELKLLQQQNERLTEQLRQNPPLAAAATTGTAATVSKGNPDLTAAKAAVPASAANVTSSAPLVLGPLVVKPLANPDYPDGLKVTLPFTRNRGESLGVAHVFLRLPKNSSSRIVDIAASDATGYTEVRKYVKADGKFAAFEGTPTATGTLQLELSVSTAATADLRGACEPGAIGPFLLEITPTAATARGE